MAALLSAAIVLGCLLVAQAMGAPVAAFIGD
jgi:hypothetical protein